MRKKLICFDLDGTLIHANKAHASAYFKAFKLNNLKPVSRKKLIYQFGIVESSFLPRLYPNLTQKEINKIKEDKRRFFYKEDKKYLKPIPKIKNALKKLRKEYEIAVTSNCSHKTILIALKQTGLRKYVYQIIGNDDVKYPKPCPDEIFKAEHLLHLHAEYIVGDTIYDIIAGKKSKTKTIAVLTGNHSKNKLKKYKPDLIVRSAVDLPGILLKK